MHRLQRLGVGHHRVLLPADQSLDGLADRVARVVRGDDGAETPAPHDLTDTHRREIGRRGLDPGPIRRVQRHPVDPHQRLSRTDRRNRFGAQLERILIDTAGRTFAKDVAAILPGGVGDVLVDGRGGGLRGGGRGGLGGHGRLLSGW